MTIDEINEMLQRGEITEAERDQLIWHDAFREKPRGDLQITSVRVAKFTDEGFVLEDDSL